MALSPGYIAAAAAAGVALLAGVAYAVSSSSSSAQPSPTPVPLQPITFTAGRRYQVTLTAGNKQPPGLPDLTVIQGAFDVVNLGAFHVVSASMNATQVIYIVDCLQSVTESPTTLYGGYNSAALGGIGVQVTDLGPTPAAAVGATLQPPAAGASTTPALPPAVATTTAPAPVSTNIVGTTPVTDPALVSYAQGVITALGTGVPINGNPSDPATRSAVSAYQTTTFGAGAPGVSYGTLDWQTWGSLLLSLLFHSSTALPTDTPTSDPTLTAIAQRALAVAVGRGIFSRLSFGAGDVSGNATDPSWLSALAEARRQITATTGGATVFAGPAGGGLDYYTLAFLLAAAYGPLANAGQSAPVEPATAVTDPNDVGVAAAALILLVTNGKITSAGGTIGTSGNPTDPGLVAAVSALQASRADLKRRTTAGTLDYLTLAVAVNAALPFLFAGITGSLDQAPGEKGGAFNVTTAADVAGAQMALALIASPAFAGAQPPGLKGGWSSSNVNGNAADPNWQAALALWQKNKPTGQPFSYRIDGVLDWPTFAGVLVDAFLG